MKALDAGNRIEGPGGDCVQTAMPIKTYFLWVGGVLLCLMLALDAYLPKAEPHKDYDFDRTGLRIRAPDTGIAPDTGAVAISSPATRDEAGDPQAEATGAVPAAATQSFARLEPGPSKKPQYKRSARLQSGKPGRRPPAAQPPWSSQWSYNSTPNWSWRGPIADAPRSNAKRQIPKQRAGYARSGDWNFNFAGVGRNDRCWGC